MSDYKKKILKDLVCEFHGFVSPDVQVIDFDKILCTNFSKKHAKFGVFLTKFNFE